MRAYVMLVAFAGLLGACAGREPDPVDVVQAHDANMSCMQIRAEVAANNAKVERLAKEKGWKVAQNVAAGAAGLVIPVLWFGMDWQGAASKEAAALQARQNYLGQLALQKGCSMPRTAAR